MSIIDQDNYDHLYTPVYINDHNYLEVNMSIIDQDNYDHLYTPVYINDHNYLGQ